MNNKFLIIFCVLLSLIGVYYYNNNKLTNVWDLISEKTIIIYEVNNPYEVWKKFKISYKKETKENELYDLIEKKIDTINLFLENELINFSKENKLLIGINIISKNKIESIFFIEKNKINKKYFFKKIDSLGYAINERIYNENKIYEVNDNSNNYNFLFINDFMIFSGSSLLIEDVIRTSKNKKLSFQFNNEDLFKQVKLEKDFGNLYLNFNKINELINVIINNNNFIKLDVLPKSSFLDIDYNKNNFYLNGFTSTINQTFKSNIPISESMYKLIPTNTIYFYHLNSNNINDFNIVNNFDDDSLNIYFGYEIGRIIVENDFSNSHEEILIFNKENLKNINVSDSSEYKNYFIKTLKKNILKNLLNKTFIKDSIPIYYFEYDKFLFFGTKTSILRNYIDDIINKKLWGKKIYYNNYISKLNKNSNISLIINIDKLLNNLIPSKKYKIIKHFDFISFQMKGIENKFYTNITIQEKDIKLKYEEKIQPNKTFIAENKLIIKPNIVFSHLDNSPEIITQDKNFNVYQLSSDLKPIWKDSIDNTIISKVFQIDYYRNNKKQILFSTKKNIHSYDRKGNKLIGFPLKNPSISPIEFINLIDYDNSKRFRIAVANKNGEVYLLNKNGKKLSGWNPLVMNNELNQAPKHIRIAGKDYIIIILKNGEIYLKNRKGENYKGFPIKTKSTISSKVYLAKGGNSKNSFIEIIDDEGNFYKINFNGKIISLDQKYRPSKNSKFKIIQDPLEKYYKILSINYNSIFISNKEENDIKLTFNNNNNFIYQYYNFGSNNEIFSLLDNNENKIYLYKSNYDLLTDYHLNSTLPISIIYSSRKRKFDIYKIFNNTLSLIEINK
ncbi:uncharacterized protein METZ01_LOCUS39520 [marine metagenome]|uniref:DUF3352 domain-containing protein n=1 Tax=marine metagenome TaxID=408172 RepID=A0A381R4I1_9ZZZZ